MPEVETKGALVARNRETPKFRGSCGWNLKTDEGNTSSCFGTQANVARRGNGSPKRKGTRWWHSVHDLRLSGRPPCFGLYRRKKKLTLVRMDAAMKGEDEGHISEKLTRVSCQSLPPFPQSPRGKVRARERMRASYSGGTVVKEAASTGESPGWVTRAVDWRVIAHGWRSSGARSAWCASAEHPSARGWRQPNEWARESVTKSGSGRSVVWVGGLSGLSLVKWFDQRLVRVGCSWFGRLG